jgi:hypothetical protein
MRGRAGDIAEMSPRGVAVRRADDAPTGARRVEIVEDRVAPPAGVAVDRDAEGCPGRWVFCYVRGLMRERTRGAHTG